MDSPVAILLFNFCLTGIFAVHQFTEVRKCSLFSDSDCDAPMATIALSYDDYRVGVLCLTNVLALILFKYLFYFYLARKYGTGLANQVSPCDFTLLCKVRKAVITDEASIPSLVDAAVNGDSSQERINALKICPVHDIKELVNVTRSLMLVEKKLMISHHKIDRTIISIRKRDEPILEELEKEKLRLKDRLSALRQELDLRPMTKFTGWVFVTFATVRELEAVQRRRSPLLTRFFSAWYSNWLRVPEPNDILWENWRVSFAQRLCLRVGVFMVVFFMIAVNLGVILFFNYLQKLANGGRTGDSSVGAVFLSVVISIVIGFFNFLIKIVLIWVTKFEAFKTKTDQFASIVFKITTCFFANRALILLFVGKILEDDWAVFGPAKVTGTIFISIFVNALLDILMYLCDPVFLVRWYKRRIIMKEKDFSKLPFLQFEANEAYEGLDFNIAEAYFLQFSSVYLAFFYQAVLPWGLLAAVGEVGAKFLVIKWVLIKRCKRPHDLEFEFNLAMFRQFEIGIGILAIGFVIFHAILVPSPVRLNVFYILALVFGGFEMFIGSNPVNYFFRRKTAKHVPEDFEFYEKTFPVDYDRLNPTTQFRCFPKFLEKIRMQDKVPLDQLTESVGNHPANPAIADYAMHNGGVALADQQIFKLHSQVHIRLRDQSHVHNSQGMPNLYMLQEEILQQKRRTVLGEQKLLNLTNHSQLARKSSLESPFKHIEPQIVDEEDQSPDSRMTGKVPPIFGLSSLIDRQRQPLASSELGGPLVESDAIAAEMKKDMDITDEDLLSSREELMPAKSLVPLHDPASQRSVAPDRPPWRAREEEKDSDPAPPK